MIFHDFQIKMRRILGAAIFFLALHSSWVVKKLRSQISECEDWGGARTLSCQDAHHHALPQDDAVPAADQWQVRREPPVSQQDPQQATAGRQTAHCAGEGRCPSVPLSLYPCHHVSGGGKLLVLCNARLGDWETGRGHDRDEVISQDGHHN